jgi:hypothetical protein
MKSRSHSVVSHAALIAVLVVGLAGVPFGSEAEAAVNSCDWQRGDLHKMHWPQLPDLSPTGVDLSFFQTVLADDFRCTAMGPIRDIHLWGSFLDDRLPKEGADTLTFELSIYSDKPAEKNGWSYPGEVLWTRTFEPGQYNVRQVHDGPESWYDILLGLYLPGNHRHTYQFNFCIGEPFIQEEGKVYWLVVKELSSELDYRFGWKTTARRFQWNDAAVYLHPKDQDWYPATYAKGHEYAGDAMDLAFVITSGDQSPPEYDLGDAPDSSNSFAGVPMLAYPSGVAASFPTVYLEGSPPYGPLHLRPRDMLFLGTRVSFESEADLGPDEDGINNLDPINDAADRDGGDDGLRLPVVMPHCQRTTLDYTVTVTAAFPERVYVNVWCDWNRDGDWDDRLTCDDGTVAAEWAVQNHQPTLPGPGTHGLTTPAFRSWHPPSLSRLDPMWVRISVAEQPWAPGADAAVGGAGPAGGYDYGETEDYYLIPQTEQTPTAYDWGDAPDGAAAPGYPTLVTNDGARHVIAGPWLGDENDRPDGEGNGQPDPDALGDDDNGSDDENGVCIGPLVRGQRAAATVEVNGGGGIVQAWIDFNGDQAWHGSEQIHDGYLPDGVHVISFVVPNSVSPGRSVARFRISTGGGLEPDGAALDGEVEDHAVLLRLAPADVKWCQWPDLTPRGIDIRVDNGDGLDRAVADDFECKLSNRLTHIRLWGSWKDDRKGEIKRLRLRIHPDDPVGPEGPDKKNLFSKPRPEVLWERDFLPGQYEETFYHTLTIGHEWWWDPASNDALPAGDTQVWQIDVSVDPDDAFQQDGSETNPRIYWLAVEVEAAGGEFGWKTRHWPGHFMDDAVWDSGEKSPRIWNEMFYPRGHQLHEHERNSVDMAFCLAFSQDSTEPVTCQPVCVTTCPPVETSCPAVLTQCPTMPTSCPSTSTACPSTVTECPAVETICPTTETKCPMMVTHCPAEETRCPSSQTQCPAFPTRCPTVETECPPSVTACPPVQTTCPPVETKCPPSVTSCPLVETQCQQSQTQCPPVETQCPAVETRCPGVHTQCPLMETACPTTETKCPATVTQCPVVQTRCPATNTSCPVAKTRCPAVETQCPLAETMCPTVSTQCPTVKTQCPATLTLCRMCILSEDSGDDTPLLMLGAACPVVETTCPKVSEYVAAAGPTQ